MRAASRPEQASQGDRAERVESATVAITCMSLCTQDLDSCLLGTDAGCVFKCSIPLGLLTRFESTLIFLINIPFLDPKNVFVFQNPSEFH